MNVYCKLAKSFQVVHSWQQYALNPVRQQSPLPQLSSFICVKPVWHFPSQKGADPSQIQLDGDGDGALTVAVVVVVAVTVVKTWTVVRWAVSAFVPPTAPPTIAPMTITIIIMIIMPSLRRYNGMGSCWGCCQCSKIRSVRCPMMNINESLILQKMK